MARRMSNGYVVYPGGRPVFSLAKAKKAAKAESKQDGYARVESVDTGKTMASYRYGQPNPSKRSVRKRVAAALKKYVRGNPPRVKGRKVKGGRAVSLKNFTGTVVKKANGQVQIMGRGRR